jgi:uncharacterized membrane protein YjgN (DUF898 family)
MIFGFGDMLLAVYAEYREYDETVCHPVDKGDQVSPFCSSNRSSGYIGVYKLFVGDVNADDFNANALSMVLFVAATFLGVIILLNMLIATVLESYEKSIQSSNKLFGRTRVALVAKSILLEEVLRSKSRWSVIARLGFGLVFISILLYPIVWSIYNLSLYSEQLDNEVLGLVVFVSIITVLLLLYFLTVVLVHYFKVLFESSPRNPIFCGLWKVPFSVAM